MNRKMKAGVRLLTFLMILMLTILQFSRTFAQTWQWQNPLPQGNDLSSVWAFTSDHIVASGSYGTLLITTNAGLSWKVDYVDTSDYRISIRSIHFVDSLYGWSVGGREGTIVPSLIYKTTDGGHRWSRQAILNLEISALHFWDRQLGWVVGGHSQGVILKTIDGGTAWLDRSSFTLQGLVDVFFVDALNGWSVGRNGFIVKTTNGGDTWTPQSINALQLLTVHFVDSLRGWIGGTNSNLQGFVAKTTNGGGTWISQLSRPEEAMFFDVYFANSQIGCAVGGNAFLFGTTNTGRIYRTTNGGTNWAPIETGMRYPLFSVHFSGLNSGWAVGSLGRIVGTTDAGNSWHEYSRASRVRISDCDFIDTVSGIGAGWSGNLLFTSDGGSSWRTWQTDSLINFLSCVLVNNSTAFAVGGYRFPAIRRGVISKTTDAGVTWSTSVFDSIDGFLSVSFSNQYEGWVLGRHLFELRVLKTTDGGTTWSPPQLVVIGTSDFPSSIRFFDNLHGWIAASSRVFRTTNGGASWQWSSSGITQPVADVAFSSPLQGWAAGGSEIFSEEPESGVGVIYRTEDGGITWVQQLYIERDAFVAVDFVNTTRGWAVGYNGLVYRTSNGGVAWEPQRIPTRVSFYSVAFRNPSTAWICGDRAAILKARMGGVTDVQKPQPGSPRDFALHQNHPNPFNSQTIIEFNVSRREFVSIEVFNALGQRVRTILKAFVEAGRYSRPVDAAGLSSGVYFYRMNAGRYIATRKMVYIQ